jgi:glycosyltransferase involved in cell wall biosynthesis
VKIAIDLTPLQTPHRMRGIGATIINFINNVSEEDKRKHSFIFIIYKDKENPFNLLKIDGLDYTVTEIASQVHQSKLPKRYNIPARIFKGISKLTEYYLGDNRLKKIKNVDVFLQFEQDKCLPKGRVKKILVVYDLIQYVLETDYLFGYKVARNKGFSRKSALKCHVNRFLYIHKIRVNVKRANKLLAISTKTKEDFIKYANAPSKKIVVIPLGVNKISNTTKSIEHHHYVPSSWGYIKRPYKIEKPYLLFVGGTDSRRKIVDLITAYNHLRTQNYNLKLIFAGDILQGPENIPVQETKKALESSSYSDDIIYMGFVSEDAKNDLYKNALAFVYPSIYEGFGLPVLEALDAGCPTICYDIPTIREVAGNKPMYAKNYYDIVKYIKKLQKDKNTPKLHRIKYTWKSTSELIIKESLGL